MKWIKFFENFRKLNESVEDSLEDIKWVLVDYDNIVNYEYYPNSTNLLVFRVTSFLSEDNLERIYRLANGEGWNIKRKSEFLIFYNESGEEAILNWLDENYRDLEIKVESNGTHRYYHKNEYLFTVEKVFKENGELFSNDVFMDISLYEVPLVCMGDANLLDVVLKKWLENTYDIISTNIYFED